MTGKKKCCPWILVLIAIVLGITATIASQQDPAAGPSMLVAFEKGLFAFLEGTLPVLVFFSLLKYLSCNKSNCCCKSGACSTGAADQSGCCK